MVRVIDEQPEKRMHLFSTHLHLGKHGKSNAVVQGAEFFDLILRAWFLSAKVIAGKSAHYQPALVVTLMQFLQTRVVRGESALGGDVDNEKHLASVFSEAYLASFDIICPYFMQVLRHGYRLPNLWQSDYDGATISSRRWKWL